MRYVMKQKVFTLADAFTIRTEAGEDIYQVHATPFQIWKNLSFTDMAGSELALISQKPFTMGHVFEIYRNGGIAATVQKEFFTFFHCRFDVDVPGPDDLEAEGQFLDHEYTFTRAGRPVAQVSKEWLTWGDTYGVDVADGEDDVLILASTVVIDMACHEK